MFFVVDIFTIFGIVLLNNGGKMIEGLFIDYDLEPCSCGEKKAPSFWFKLDASWGVRCVSDYCTKRWRNVDFVKPKKKAQEIWNAEQIAEKGKE
jgi:hypothetical protein